jgi:hypothetical protein
MSPSLNTADEDDTATRDRHLNLAAPLCPKRKSLPREEVRQAFRKEPNSDWEEERRCSDRRPLGGGAGRLKHEALREEVHCFVESEYMRL